MMPPTLLTPVASRRVLVGQLSGDPNCSAAIIRPYAVARLKPGNPGAAQADMDIIATNLEKQYPGLECRESRANQAAVGNLCQ